MKSISNLRLLPSHIISYRSVLDNTAKLFEFAPGKVAFNVDVLEENLADLGVCIQACFNRVKDALGQWVATQVDYFELL